MRGGGRRGFQTIEHTAIIITSPLLNKVLFARPCGQRGNGSSSVLKFNPSFGHDDGTCYGESGEEDRHNSYECKLHVKLLPDIDGGVKKQNRRYEKKRYPFDVHGALTMRE